MKHITKDGKEIALKDLDINHLKNIIAMIERNAKKGITVKYGGMGIDIDELWYEEEFLDGKKALDFMNYSKYISELNRR